MGGTGNFNRNNKTLYVAGFKIMPGDNPEEILKRHFSEWGEIDRCAFPGNLVSLSLFLLFVFGSFIFSCVFWVYCYVLLNRLICFIVMLLLRNVNDVMATFLVGVLVIGRLFTFAFVSFYPTSFL